MDLTLTKRDDGAFIPSYDSDYEKAAKVRIGATVFAKTKSDRNVKHHRKFFALLNLVFDNLPEHLNDQIKSVDHLLWHVKMQVGHYDMKLTLGGKPVPEAKSINFNMPQEDFEFFFNRSLDVICKYILIGANQKELRDEIIHNF